MKQYSPIGDKVGPPIAWAFMHPQYVTPETEEYQRSYPLYTWEAVCAAMDRKEVYVIGASIVNDWMEDLRHGQVQGLRAGE